MLLRSLLSHVTAVIIVIIIARLTTGTPRHARNAESARDIVQRMDHTVATDIRYPIGKPDKMSGLDDGQRRKALTDLAELPALLRKAVSGLTDAQLDTPYRDGGWTGRQVVHHVADSHMNAYVRVRLALTEVWPTIRPYEESKWALLHDAQTLPVEVSLALLDQLHRRWVTLLESLAPADWELGYIHPESGRQTLGMVLALYSWHGRHHVAHVTELRRRLGW